ncbi:MAG: winged helix-turn-helix transcriptional regulator [Actinomycetota bacterium]
MTPGPAVTPDRTYADACGTAHALDLIGERWALLVVRELLLGPKRYSDLLADLPGISTNVLAARLDSLERTGIVLRRRLPPPAASAVYELTMWGAELEPVICAIGRWGARSPLHDKTANFSVASFVLSLRTNFSKAAADGLRTTIQFRMPDDTFVAKVRGGRFSVDRGEAADADAILTGEPATFAGIIYGGLTVNDAITLGLLTMTGDPRMFERFRSSFVLPPVAQSGATGSVGH